MQYGDDVVTLLHDDPNMAITFFGSINSIKNIQRVPSRIPISIINPYHHERERDKTCYHHEKERNSIEYKDRSHFHQDINARYFDKIRKRIKSSYARYTTAQAGHIAAEAAHTTAQAGHTTAQARHTTAQDGHTTAQDGHTTAQAGHTTAQSGHTTAQAGYTTSQSCNQPFCPKIKERMEHHQKERHCLTPKSDGYSSHHNIDIGTMTTKIVVLENCTSAKCGPDFEDNHSIQTNVNGISDTSNKMRHDNNYNSNSNASELLISTRSLNNNVSDIVIKLKRTETRELLTPKRKIYKDYVQKEVREWFQEVLTYPELGKNCDFDKDDIKKELADKINNLFNESNSEEYDRKIACIIDSSLNGVLMWYPGAKRDQDLFKNNLVNSLLNRIKTVRRKVLTNNVNNNDNDCRASSRRSSNKYLLNNFDEVEEEICNWLSEISIRKRSSMQMLVNKKDISIALMKRVAPLFRKPMNTCHYKLNLKSAIFDVLKNLPTGAKYSRNRNIHLQQFSEDLANRLLSIRAKLENRSRSPSTQRAMNLTSEIFGLNNTKNNFEKAINSEISKCFEDTRFTDHNDVKIKITNIIMDYVDSSVPVKEFDVKKDIINVLRSTSHTPEFLASNIAQNLLRKVIYALNLPSNNAVSSIKPTTTRDISVYRSEEKICTMNYPVTSTPNKKNLKKCVPKLNPEEIEYEEKVGNLIRAWMETLPEQFNAPDEKDFKDTIIKDLAGDITDEAKLEQLVTVDDREKWLKYLVYKWLQKLDVFDLEEVAPQVQDLLKRVKDIPIPVLTRPQGGNRQAMANIQHMDSERGWNEYFVPKGKDILKDEISIWMNEQPSEIFDTDKNTRNHKIHELAEVLENKLIKTRPEKEILNDVAVWLSHIVKPEQRTNVDELADNLKDRVINLPQDDTLAASRDKKVKQRAENLKVKENPDCHLVKLITRDNETVNLDNTMQKFIAKFIEHTYDVADPMARGAFSYLLKTKLQRLNPPTRKEVYENFTKSTNKHLSREKLTKELEYIKDISDWLKNIPIEASYNTVGNRERIDFVNDLAINVYEVEEQRENNPDAMDYNMYMASIISQFLVQLPIVKEYRNDKNMMFMIDQLVGKIIVHRNKFQKVFNSIDTSGVHSENVGDFIEEFIRVNGSEIADDEIKLEAWSVRLLNEIKNMVRENADPTLLSKAQVYNRLTNVPLQGDESVKQFDSEFEYIKEISEWIKNLPLLPLEKTDEEERIRMICMLTEKITERDTLQSNLKPNENKAEAEFAKYVSKWISDLSLDESREVIVSVVVQQLINRIERVKTRQGSTHLDYKQAMKNVKLSGNNDPEIIKKQSSVTKKTGKNKQMKNPANTIIDAIDKWSASLPIKADDAETVKSLKDGAAKKLYQTVGELSIDPRTFNDDLLYQEILSDEVNAVVERLPASLEIENNKEKLTTEIVQNIVEAQKANKEKYAGKLYKQKLEHTIQASIPHPVKTRQAYDPGFEIYKSRLADMFILENFDHANDAVKIKYEKRIKDEIDKYYDSVKNKNAIALTKDEIYNELYSVLFKVPLPNESSVIGEVEEIKTRCEIDTWFEELPLKEASGIIELLERDKILETLAKRIYEIEKTKSKSADVHKEIMKWLMKLPFLPGQENNLEQFAKKLQNTLKSSVKQRQCVVTDPSSTNKKRKKGKGKVKSTENVQLGESKVPGSSADGKMWNSQLERVQPKKKATEIVMDTVETWCNQLPVHGTTLQDGETAKIIRDNLYTKIIIKISELNMYSEIFNDDLLYDKLLDEELDKLLSVLPTSTCLEHSKAARKLQLIDSIKSVKPLFKEEKARHQYKQNLDKTIAKVLGKPKDTTADKEAQFNDLKEEIVDDFVQYHYNLYDDEGRKAYKIKIHDAIIKFLTDVAESKEETMNPLMRRNQLLCELAKIPIPSEEGLKKEVEEIRMKNEISEFFDDSSISDKDKKVINQAKSSLAKKLNDIELNGHNPENDAKMKQEIAKSLKKINKEVKNEAIDDFVTKLNNNENVRRAPRINETSRNDNKRAGVNAKNTLHIQEKPKKSQVECECPSIEFPKNERKPKQSQVECECPSIEFPKNERKPKKSHVECECPSIEFPENARPQTSENLEDNRTEPDNDKNDQCSTCGRMREATRPCYMHMNWFWNSPEVIPMCRPPAGFFYY